jgi:hypothetical protein
MAWIYPRDLDDLDDPDAHDDPNDPNDPGLRPGLLYFNRSAIAFVGGVTGFGGWLALMEDNVKNNQ